MSPDRTFMKNIWKWSRFIQISRNSNVLLRGGYDRKMKEGFHNYFFELVHVWCIRDRDKPPVTGRCLAPAPSPKPAGVTAVKRPNEGSCRVLRAGVIYLHYF